MRKLRWIAAIGFLLLLLFAFWQLRGSRTMNDPQTLAELIPDDTILYDADGQVDFVAMLNARLSRDIRPEQNAFIDYLKILGRSYLDDKQFAEMCAELGVESIEFSAPFMRFADARTDVLAGEINPWNEISRRPWTSEEFPACAAWLAQNEQHLQTIRAASAKTQFFCPLIFPDESRRRPMIELPLDYDFEMREIVRWLDADTLHSVAKNDAQNAIADVIAVHGISQQTSHSMILMQKLLAANYDHVATLHAAAIIGNTPVTAEQLNTYRQFLQNNRPQLDVTNGVSVGDRYIALDTVQVFETRGVSSLSGISSEQIMRTLASAAVDWKIVATTVNDRFDSIVAAMGEPRDMIRLKLLDQIESEMTPSFDEGWQLAGIMLLGPAARGKALGEILANFLCPTAQILAMTEIRTKMQREILDLGLAIAEFRLDNGGPPKTLDLLVPKYVEAVPLDRFSGKPLIYRVYDDGFELISVGRDGKFDDDPDPDSSKDIRFVARPYKPIAAETPPDAAPRK